MDMNGISRTMLGIAAASISWCGTTPASAQPCDRLVWRQVFPDPSPPPAAGGQMVYDSGRHLSVLLIPGQTWEWNGELWQFRAPEAPQDGWGFAAAYDSWRHVTILFTTQGETWTWDGDQWRRVATEGPGARGGAAMAFDSDRGVAVLFGGSRGSALRDTWEWDGGAWAIRANPPPDDDSPPERRSSASMCYDPIIQRTVMCCGMASGGYGLDDTWLWDGVNWRFVAAPLEFPGIRYAAPMVFDSGRGKCVLFGGAWDRFGDRVLDDTWEFDGASWSRSDATGPSRRFYAAMSYDETRGKIVLFGGHGYRPGDFTDLDDTWIAEPNMEIRTGPVIETQPADQDVELGATAVLAVAAAGEGDLTYQWRFRGRAIDDAGHYSGSRTPMLTITDAQISIFGAYDVVVANPCSSVVSEAAFLFIDGRCPSDFNVDGVSNSQDFFDFLNAFFAGAPAADLNHSGTVDSSDLSAFFAVFFYGCW